MKIIISDNYYINLLCLDDADKVFDFIDNDREHLQEWLPFVNNTKEPADITKFLEICTAGRLSVYAMMYEGVFAGMIGFTKYDKDDNKAEIGYWLGSVMQGNGLVIRAVKALLEYSFTHLELNRVTIRCALGNHKSRKIPENLGFTFEGVEREGEKYNDDLYFDIAVYSLLRSEYKPSDVFKFEFDECGTSRFCC